MSHTSAATAIEKSLAPITEKITKLADEVGQLKEKANQPVYRPGANPYQVYGITGQRAKDSEGYSILRALAFAKGFINRDQAKIEFDTHLKLKSLYAKAGYHPHYGSAGFLVPFNTAAILPESSEDERFVEETRYRIKAYQGQFDAEEARYVTSKTAGRHYQKALGTLVDTAGGVLTGFPTLGEMIDLQRNMEAFPNAGASEIALPPNARIQFPKLTNGATAYWVGEAAAITESQETTGYLDLSGKKLGVLVKINNELLRYASPTTEGLVRTDMARVAALRADLAMLEGTGGTQIKGLITYPTSPTWTVGTDNLIAHTASSVDINGNTFEVEDVALMEGKLPDIVDAPTAWLMRKNMFSNITNRRADAAVQDDRAGQFMFWTTRSDQGNGPQLELYGTKVIRSSQISNTRVKGTGTNLTYILLGYFPDWIIARFGVMEFLATNLGDTAFQNDQTWIRGIQILDAGPRHAASFVLCDQLLIA